MNTPTAIFLGLALIAVAIFIRQPSISEAQATRHGVVHGWAIDDNASQIITRSGHLLYCYKDNQCLMHSDLPIT